MLFIGGDNISRLIDADAFDRRLAAAEFNAALLEADDQDRPFEHRATYYSTQSFRDVMKNQPTIKAVPVWLLEAWRDDEEEMQIIRNAAHLILGVFERRLKEEDIHTETCINYCEPGWAYMSSDERRWINRLRKLAEQHPGECEIIKQPEVNGGFIYARFPQKWARVNPPKQVVMSEARRAAMAENLRSIRRSSTSEEDDYQ